MVELARELAPEVAHLVPAAGAVERGKHSAVVGLLLRDGLLSLVNTLQGLFVPHPLPSVGPRFGLPGPLPAYRRPETWDSPPTLLPDGGDRSIRLTARKWRADERTRTADLLITSDPSAVAGVYRGLRIPHS